MSGVTVQARAKLNLSLDVLGKRPDGYHELRMVMQSSGLCDEVYVELRESGYQLPILVVTAKDTFPDKLKGFKLGIDDYMVKPIDVNELLLRVEALLRRARIIYEKKLEFPHVCLDYINLTVTVDGKPQILPQKEFQLLYKLLSFPNQTFTRQQLMDELWGYDSETDIRTVDVHVNRLRDRFREVPYFQILTVRGLGYKGTVEK